MSYPGEKFVIKKSSDKTGYVYLVNRDITKKKWWTPHFSEAMIFLSEYAANVQCDKLKYGNPRVEKLREAWDI